MTPKIAEMKAAVYGSALATLQYCALCTYRLGYTRWDDNHGKAFHTLHMKALELQQRKGVVKIIPGDLSDAINHFMKEEKQ